MPTFLAILVFLIGLPSLQAAEAERDASGIFLVAKREMRDPRFRETVVLVTQPREGGPIGVIINKPLEHRLSEVFPEYEGLKNRKDLIYFGGPVAPQGPIVLLRAEKAPANSLRVLKDVFLITDADVIDGLLKRKDPMRGLRIFAGYSGWAPGQLQGELARGDWHVVPADPETVFDKPARDVWPELERRATTKHTRKDEGGRMKDDLVFTTARRGSSLILHPSSFESFMMQPVLTIGGAGW